MTNLDSSALTGLPLNGNINPNAGLNYNYNSLNLGNLGVPSFPTVGSGTIVPNQSQILGTAVSNNTPAPTPAPAPGPTTTAPSSGGSSGGGSDLGWIKANYPGYAGWGDAAIMADYKATGGSGKGGAVSDVQGANDLSSQISDAYAPYMDWLNAWSGSLEPQRQSDISNVGATYNTGAGNINNEQAGLDQNLSTQNQNLFNSNRSAVADAVRSYNALMQQAAQRFGFGTGTGQAMTDIVGQQLLRNEGNMAQTYQQGLQSLAAQGIQVKTYIGQKMGQLDQWKRDALTSIDTNFQSTMNEINGRKADVEANKTKDKMNAMQAAIQRAQDVQNADTQFRQQLGTYAAAQLAQAAQQSFTPQDIASPAVQQIVQQALNFSGLSATTPQGSATKSPLSYLGTYDQYGKLIQPTA